MAKLSMRGNAVLLDLFDYAKELDESNVSRPITLANAFKYVLRNKESIDFSGVEKCKFKRYERMSIAENISIEINEELYKAVRKIFDNYYIGRIQQPFICRIVLSTYIKSLLDDTNTGLDNKCNDRVNVVLNNKTTNLIPIVNPGLHDKSGIECALLYRMCPCIEIDSSERVRAAYQEFYGEDIPESSDTIFNAFIPFLDFCRAKLMLLQYKVPNKQKELLALIYIHLDEIFNGYSDLRHFFDRYFNLMYSFSNFMPVPKYFNGSKDKKGKGNWKLNKDYPSEYYKNLEDSNSGIYERESMKKWLDGVMQQYKIESMYRLKPPYPIYEYYGFDDEKLQLLINFIKDAIRIIEDR